MRHASPLLVASVALTAAVVAAAPPAAVPKTPAQLGIRLGYPRLVAEQTGHLWFPKLAVLPGGRLHVVCSGQPDSGETTGGFQTTSLDQGTTWAPLAPWRYGGVTNWTEGNLLVGLPWDYTFVDAGRTAVRGSLVAVDAQGKSANLDREAVRITGFPRALAEPSHGHSSSFTSDCDGVVTTGKRMLTLGYCRFEGDEEKHRTGGRSQDASFGYTLVAIESLDGGRTWRYLTTVCDWTDWTTDPNWVDRGRFEGPCESSLVELADGSLMAVFRVGMFEQNPLHTCVSTDGGKTWSRPKALPACSVLPSLQRLSGGGLILATGRPGIWLWYSADGRGDTWEPIDALAHHNAAVEKDHPQWLITPTKQFNRFHTSSNVQIREIAPGRLLLIYDRIPFDWQPVPKDSPERNRIFVLPIEVGRGPAGPPGTAWDGKRFAGGPAVTELPSALAGLTVIAPPRGHGAEPAPEWSLRTNLPATVYLGVMDRGGYVPPAEWEPTGMEIRSGNLSDRVYRRRVPAGKVTVPGHTGMSGAFFGVPHLVLVAADDGRQAELMLDDVAIPEATPLPDPGPQEIDFRYGVFPSHRLIRFFLPQPPEGVSRWTVSLRRQGDARPLAERSGSFPMSAAGENLETPDLPAALYFVECTLEAAGNPIRLNRWFYRQTFPWEQEKLGLEDVVIPPFEPLAVDESSSRVSCVLRTHEHGSAGLWKQVTSQGRTLLAGPVRLEATAGGRTVAATGGAATITAKKPTRVDGTAAWRAGGLEGTTNFAYDYDGYTEFTLRLAPSDTAIDRLQLVIPLEASEAWLLHPVTTLLRHHDAGRVPAGTGKVWDSANLPGGGMLGTFVPYLFLGGPERGICFAADNDRDWVSDPKVPAVEIDRDGETVNLRLNLVGRPHRLTRPRTIRFALQATPAKPMPMDPVSWRRWWFTRGPRGQRHDVQGTMLGVNLGWGAAQLVTDIFPADQDVSFWEAMAANRASGTMNQDFLGRWKGRHPALAQSFPTYKWGLETVSFLPPNAAGTTPATFVFPYLNPRGGSSLDPAFATTYLDEWSAMDVASPGWKPGPDRALREKLVPCWYGCEPVPSNVDRQVWWQGKMVETFSDGPYWDNFFLKASWVPSEAGGPAYVDDEGRLKPGVNLSGFRSLVKRTAVMMHARGKRPLSWIHMTNANLVPVLSFGTVNLDWEWRDLGKQAGVDIQDRLGIDRDPALVLVQSLGLQSGNVPVAIDRFHAEGKEAIAWQMRTGLAVCLPHEIRQKDGGPDAAFAQAALDEFGYGLPDCKVFRYWEDRHPLKATGARIRGLVLARDGKALLVIGNYGQEPPAGEETVAADASPARAASTSVAEYDAGVAKRGAGEAAPRPSERPVFTIRLHLDLAVLGLPETVTATDLEQADRARTPRKPGPRAADDLAEALESELAGGASSGRLARVAPGVFELSIKHHDFRLILVE